MLAILLSEAVLVLSEAVLVIETCGSSADLIAAPAADGEHEQASGA